MYPDQLVSGQLIQIYTVFKTSYTQVQHGKGHFTFFTGHHISLIFIFVNFLRILCTCNSTKTQKKFRILPDYDYFL